MNRKDYVTENLVYIRDHMRASTRQAAAPAVEAEPAETPAAVSPAAAAPAADNARERAVWKRLTEATQAKRDLAGRLARDLAELEQELQQEEEQIARKRRLRDDLAVQTAELQRLTPESAGDTFPRDVENLRLAYFRTVGQRAALARQTGEKPSSPSHPGQRTEIYTAALIAAGGMTLAGIIIAAAIAAVFL